MRGDARAESSPRNALLPHRIRKRRVDARENAAPAPILARASTTANFDRSFRFQPPVSAAIRFPSSTTNYAASTLFLKSATSGDIKTNAPLMPRFVDETWLLLLDFLFLDWTIGRGR